MPTNFKFIDLLQDGYIFIPPPTVASDNTAGYTPVDVQGQWNQPFDPNLYSSQLYSQTKPTYLSQDNSIDYLLQDPEILDQYEWRDKSYNEKIDAFVNKIAPIYTNPYNKQGLQHKIPEYLSPVTNMFVEGLVELLRAAGSVTDFTMNPLGSDDSNRALFEAGFLGLGFLPGSETLKPYMKKSFSKFLPTDAYKKGVKKLTTNVYDTYKKYKFRERDIPYYVNSLSVLTSPNTVKAIGRLDDDLSNLALGRMSTHWFLDNQKLSNPISKFSNTEFRKEIKKLILDSERAKKLNPGINFGNDELKFHMSSRQGFNDYVDYYNMFNRWDKSSKNLAKFIDKDYTNKMQLINTNSVFKDIATESPQYIDLIYEHLKNPKISDDAFVNNLVKQSNTFTRALSEPTSPDDFFTLKGSSLSKGFKERTMDVEGFPVSDWYGDYRYRIEPNNQRMSEISALPIEQRWGQRFPENFSGHNKNVSFEEGWRHKGGHPQYVDWFKKKLDRARLVSRNTIIPKHLPMSSFQEAPLKYIHYPQHQIFSTKGVNQKLKGFNVLPMDISVEDTYNYIPGFSRGFQEGGEKLPFDFQPNPNWKPIEPPEETMSSRPYQVLDFFNTWDAPDSRAEDLAEMVDPTGLLSWDDVQRAARDNEFTYEDILEPLGAIPMYGTTKKGINIFKGAPPVSWVDRLNLIEKWLKGVNYVEDELTREERPPQSPQEGISSWSQSQGRMYQNGGVFTPSTQVQEVQVPPDVRAQARSDYMKRFDWGEPPQNFIPQQDNTYIQQQYQPQQELANQQMELTDKDLREYFFGTPGEKTDAGESLEIDVDVFADKIELSEHKGYLEDPNYNPYSVINSDGATGRYQFLPEWYDNIEQFAKEKGYEYNTIDDFVNNSILQDDFFQNYVKTELSRAVKKIKKLFPKKIKENNISDEKLFALVHFLGQGKSTEVLRDFLLDEPQSYATTPEQYWDKGGFQDGGVVVAQDGDGELIDRRGDYIYSGEGYNTPDFDDDFRNFASYYGVKTPESQRWHNETYDELTGFKCAGGVCQSSQNIITGLGGQGYRDLFKSWGIVSGKEDTPIYGASLDAWDIPGLLESKGGKVFYKADYDDDIYKMSNAELQDLFRQLPVGTVLNYKSGEGGEQGYNIERGLLPGNHLAMVVGYNEEGYPIMYDYGKLRPVTIDSYGALVSVVAPQEYLGYTYDNLKNFEGFDNSTTYTPMSPINLSNLQGKLYEDPKEKARYRFSEEKMGKFTSTLADKKKELLNYLTNISSEEYDDLAKLSTAIALAESKGGSFSWGSIPDAIGYGDSIGLTQINEETLFGLDDEGNPKDPELYYTLKKLGIRSKDDLFDPENSAIATMVLMNALKNRSEYFYNQGLEEGVRFYRFSGDMKNRLRDTNWVYIPELGEEVKAPKNEAQALKLQKKLVSLGGKYSVGKDDKGYYLSKLTEGNSELTPQQKIAYSWNSPVSLTSGDAQGKNEYVMKVIDYYKRLGQ